MLNWWLKKPDQRVQGKDAQFDAPETPAPVFAARALKSALFGTPAPPPEYEVEEEEEDDDDHETGRGLSRDALKDTRNLSPTKPQGILLTPGTATTRRKNVAWDHEVLDTAGKGPINKRFNRNILRKDDSEEVASPFVSKGDPASNTRRRTSLTRILESAREGKSPRDSIDIVSDANKPGVGLEADQPLLSRAALRQEARRRSTEEFEDARPDLTPSRTKTRNNTSPTRSRRASQAAENQVESPKKSASKGPSEGDMTLDLNIPHSQSGKFWKSEYEQYHQEAKMEMERLVKYKQLASSYAKKKDDEAIDLAEKLNEERKKVDELEVQVFRLSEEMADAVKDGRGRNLESKIEELVERNALANRHKAQAREIRQVMRSGVKRVAPNGRPIMDTRDEQIDMDRKWDLMKAHEDMETFSKANRDIEQLQEALATSEQRGKKLQEENATLTQELGHSDMKIDQVLEKYEKKRKYSDERIEKKDNEIKKLQRDLIAVKANAKVKLQDVEKLCKQRGDTLTRLRDENQKMKVELMTARLDLERHDKVHAMEIEEYKRQIAELRQGQTPSKRTLQDEISGFQEVEKIINSRPYSSYIDESIFPGAVNIRSDPFRQTTTSQSQAENYLPSKPDKALTLTPRPSRITSQTPAGSPKRPLSEIINSSTSNRIDSIPTPRYGPVMHSPIPAITPLATKSGSLSLETPTPRARNQQRQSEADKYSNENGNETYGGAIAVNDWMSIAERERDKGQERGRHSPRPKFVPMPGSPAPAVTRSTHVVGGVNSSRQDAHKSRSRMSQLDMGGSKHERKRQVERRHSEMDLSSKFDFKNEKDLNWEDRDDAIRIDKLAVVEEPEKVLATRTPELSASRGSGKGGSSRMSEERAANARLRLEERRRKRLAKSGGVGSS